MEVGSRRFYIEKNRNKPVSAWRGILPSAHKQEHDPRGRVRMGGHHIWLSCS
jgi:hypothetical protein